MIIDAMLARIGWALGEITLSFLGILFIVCVFFLPQWIRQSRCKHEKYFENSRCHVICSNCGLDLGFIETVREERAKKNV
jgi:hypothetical protein